MTTDNVYARWKTLLGLLLASFFLYKGWEDFQAVVSNVGAHMLGRPTFVDRMNQMTTPWSPGNLVSLGLGFATLGLLLLVLVTWLVYRVWLGRHPELSPPSMDERIRQNWMKAFRLSYFFLGGFVLFHYLMVFAIAVINAAQLRSGPTGVQSFLIELLPDRLLLIGVTSLLTSFLLYDRDRLRG